MHGGGGGGEQAGVNVEELKWQLVETIVNARTYRRAELEALFKQVVDAEPWDKPAIQRLCDQLRLELEMEKPDDEAGR